MTKISVKKWLLDSANRMKSSSDFPFMETQVLLAFVLGKTREWLLCHPEEELEDEVKAHADLLLARLEKGEPLPYITGHQSFYGLDFKVTQDVLIPRPETELLVEECNEWLEGHPNRRHMADVGTGSGIIAITLADRFEDLKITAVDISEKALAIARENAKSHQVDEKIDFLKDDLLEKTELQFDLITANLPYIPSKTLNTLAVVKYEPQLALDGGEEGLDLINRLLAQCVERIKPGGLIIFEIETNQGDAVLRLANLLFPNAKITLLDDLAKHPRILKIQV